MSGDAAVLFATAQIFASVAVHLSGEAFRQGRFRDAFAAAAAALLAAVFFLGGLRH